MGFADRIDYDHAVEPNPGILTFGSCVDVRA